MKNTFLSHGTQVLMADNTFLPIEEIKVGDRVSSLGENECVKEVFQAETSSLYVITTNTGRKISITPDQVFKVNGVYNTSAKDLIIEDLILCFDGNDIFVETITDITQVFPIEKRVYNFNLEENHNFSGNGFLCVDFSSQQKI